jgi:hypothetical protein
MSFHCFTISLSLFFKHSLTIRFVDMADTQTLFLRAMLVTNNFFIRIRILKAEKLLIQADLNSELFAITVEGGPRK